MVYGRSLFNQAYITLAGRSPRGLPKRLKTVQEDANALPLSTLRRSEIARGHGAAQRSLGLRDDDDDDLPKKKLQILLVRDFFTCWMSFLSPNQQYQSTEGIIITEG